MIEEFYRLHYERLVKIVTPRLDRNYSVAEEAVQDAFVKAITFFSAFDPDQKEFGAWFNSILNNCVKDAANKEKNRGMSLATVENIPCSRNFSPILNITKEEITGSIRTMKESTAKNVIDLYFNKGLEPRHICSILHLPSNGYVRFIISTWRTSVIKRYRI